MFNKKFNNFIKHNQRYFDFLNYNSKNKILFEFNNWSSLHIAGSYLLKCLQEKYKADIFAYSAQPLVSRPLHMSLFDRFKWTFGKIFSLKFFGIYNSIGTKDFLYPHIDKKLEYKSKIILRKILKKINHNKDIENISIYGVKIGDLIYDSYLRYYWKETIDINEKLFEKYLGQSICIFLYWKKYFDTNKINAVVLSHTVYLYGLLARIALKKKIKVYICQPDYINSLKKNIPYARYEFINAKKVLNKIPKKLLSVGISHAKERINYHLKGGKTDIWWSKNPFELKNINRVLNKNNKFKFLIATNSFIDSPHAYGENLFPDNHLWLDFIGKNTIKSDHEYYLKIHPYGDAIHEKKFTLDIIKKFIKKYPHIKLLPINVGHKQLIKEGINCVLTVFGSVGFEYALFDIPVINASNKSATVNFDFNIHIKNIAKYKLLLLNPKKIKIKIKKKEIYKYYFLRHLYYPRNWLFDDIQKAEQLYGGYSLEIYDYWIKKEFKKGRHIKIFDNLKKFINSNNYILDYQFMDRDIMIDMKNFKK